MKKPIKSGLIMGFSLAAFALGEHFWRALGFQSQREPFSEPWWAIPIFFIGFLIGAIASNLLQTTDKARK